MTKDKTAKTPVAKPRTPDPLRRAVAPPAPYPIEALGPILKPMVEAMRASIQAPDAICAQSVLAGSALAVQGHADIDIDGRTFPLSLFLLDIGLSGERRSAADRIALASHQAHEHALARAYKASKLTYETDLEIWKKTRDTLLKNQGPTTDPKKKTLSPTDVKIQLAIHGAPPIPPLGPNLLCTEPTYEGIVKTFVHGQPSIGFFSDEGGRFLGGYAMDKNNQLHTVAGLCEIWDGKRIDRVRATDDNELLYGRRLSLHLMVQPIVAQPLLNNEVMQQQGFLARCLTCWPISTIGTRPYKAVNLAQQPGVQAYHARMTSLLAATLPVDPDSPNELNPRALGLSSDAKDAWIAFHDHVESQLKTGHPLAEIPEFGSKIPDQAARPAGVLTLVEDLYAPEIDRDHMDAGIKLAQFYVTEALRLFTSAGVDPDVLVAEKLLAFLQLHHQDQRTFPLMEAYQGGPKEVRDKASAQRILGILEDYGWVSRIPEGMEFKGARRRDAYRLHDDGTRLARD